MPANKRSNGNWGKKQDKQLGDLIRANIVDHNERRPAELFRISQTHFPDFISPGGAGKRAANQRLRNKLVNYGIDLENRRGGGEFGVEHVSLFLDKRKTQCAHHCFFSHKNLATKKTCLLVKPPPRPPLPPLPPLPPPQQPQPLPARSLLRQLIMTQLTFKS